MSIFHHFTIAEARQANPCMTYAETLWNSDFLKSPSPHLKSMLKSSSHGWDGADSSIRNGQVVVGESFEYQRIFNHPTGLPMVIPAN